MDLVNIIYRYVNRFINSEELIVLLEEMDKTSFSKREKEEVEKLLKEVKQIVKTVPIEIDQVELGRLSSLNHLLEKLENIKEFDNSDNEAKEFIEERYASLLKEKEKVRDSGKRYNQLYQLLVNNSVYIKYCKNMSDLELLEFITQYISVPVTPNIDQETFDDLVSAGIKEDKRESLWRLAFNYNGKKKDFVKIVDYFIEKRDDYYLVELISAVREDLDMENLIMRVLNTKDKEFMIHCGNRAKDIGIFSDEEFEKLKEMFQKVDKKN